MKKTQVLFLAFGPRLDLYAQIYFALRSIQRWDVSSVNFVILTDKPNFFKRVHNDVDIIELSEETLRAWRGKHNFLWRIKMKAIEHVAISYSGDHILYFDSDTIVAKDMQSLISELDNDRVIMHTFEKIIAKSKYKRDMRLTKHLRSFKFLNYVFDKSTEMYNAGVIGLPANSAQTLAKEAISLCDALCETNANKTFLEQLAFSMVLGSTNRLIGVEDKVIHYWGNKEQWDSHINSFIQKSLFQNLDKNAEIELIKALDYTKIPIYIRIQASNRRLKKYVDKLFSKQEIMFFKQ
ncbi:hypothetical protein CBF23_012290 [Marinomonas agarivorans]|nr:hypothetical protein CBF23_012290 [Marinomonas agarivorans]